jgi:hypothetical protein
MKALLASHGVFSQPLDIWPLHLDGLWTDISDGMKREELSNQVGFFDELHRSVPYDIFPRQQSTIIHPNVFSLLPPEIIKMIFRFTLGASKEVQSESSTIVACSHVCKVWKDIAVNYPHLWCVLKSNRPWSQTKAFLARSQNKEHKAPLHIIINNFHGPYFKLTSHNGNDEVSNMSNGDGSDPSEDESESNDEFVDFVSLVAPHSDRWTSLTFHDSSATLLASLGDEMHFRVRVSLSCLGFTHISQSLKFLELLGSRIPLKSLTNVLAKAKKLETLRLKDCSWIYSTTSQFRAENLKSLTLVNALGYFVVHLVNVVQLPNLVCSYTLFSIAPLSLSLLPDQTARTDTFGR